MDQGHRMWYFYTWLTPNASLSTISKGRNFRNSWLAEFCSVYFVVSAKMESCQTSHTSEFFSLSNIIWTLTFLPAGIFFGWWARVKAIKPGLISCWATPCSTPTVLKVQSQQSVVLSATFSVSLPLFLSRLILGRHMQADHYYCMVICLIFLKLNF